MKCPRCDHENPSQARFCMGCGAGLSARCGKCGTELPPEARFCFSCGDPVHGVATTPRFESPGAYTPKHLADKILTSKTALEGERKQVTVLFCDIANSTVLAERLGPEGMHTLLNAFFELVLIEVHRYEGTINQFLGDGFMALFGAPLAHEDHARRAVLTALGIQRSLVGHRADLGGRHVVELSVRMGLNTGPVVVGKIGDNLRMDYTAVGDTTHLAARLEQLAEPGTVLMSDQTRQLVGGDVRLEPLPSTQIKGRAEPVVAYRVVGLGPRRSPLEGRDDRALSRFVGRAREFEALHSALEQVEAGRGQVVGMVGEAGVGKSRLMYEFRRSLASRPLTYLEGRCLAYGGAMPYLPLQDIVRQNCGIADTDAPDSIAEKVRAGLQEVGMGPEESAPYLLQLLGVKQGAERLGQIGPETIKVRIFETLREMTLKGSRRRTLIMAVEDLHWIDKTSEEYFASAVESLMGARVLMLTTYRPGYRPPWIDKSYAAQLALGPLSPSDSLSVVHSVGQQDRLPDPLEQLILGKAEGNPFFLEELTRAVSEQGDVSSAHRVPDTIQGVLMARIDRLPDEAKRVLQTASILGREFTFRLLHAVSSDAGSLAPLLRELTRLEFLYERLGADEPVYVFKHALTQEVAYASLLSPRRTALHEAAGRALEADHADRLEEQYEILAHHYSRSTNRGKALSYLELAGQKAARANAVDAAKAYFDQAMAVLDSAPDTPESRRHRMSLLVNHLTVALLTLDAREYFNLLQRHAKLAEELEDHQLRAAFYTRLGWCTWWFGLLDEAIGYLRKAASIHDPGRDPMENEPFYTTLIWSHMYKGEYQEALTANERMLAGRQEHSPSRWYVMALSGAAWACAYLGRFEDALGLAQRALRAGRAVSDDSLISFAAWMLALVYTHQGDLGEANAYAELGISAAPTPGDRIWSMAVLSWARCKSGEVTAGIDVLEQAAAALGAARFIQGENIYRLWLGEGLWRAGDLVRAKETLEGVLQVAERHSLAFHIGSACRLLAEVASSNEASADLLVSARLFERCISILETIGAQNELALAYTGYGRLLKRQGKTAQAREYLTNSVDIFERLGTLTEPDNVRAELAAWPAPE